MAIRRTINLCVFSATKGFISPAGKLFNSAVCLDNPKGGLSSYTDVASCGIENHMSKHSGNLGMKFGFPTSEARLHPPYALGFRSFIHTARRESFNKETDSKPMDFVREVVEEGGSQYTDNADQNADVVHINLMRNNTFVTVTDSKGNRKYSGSSGHVPELRGGPKMSRYTADATAEHVGREARKLGLKAIVVKVRGFTYFKKKRQAIMSFREGFTDSRSDWSPIVAIEDTTRRPHNGCRLPKKRRI
ncbi:hypothetical protein K2173_002759 [Erythroxylum novogranatense]|uniref:Ribosomal protein S11 n=1 Tax=Erythroxylum novogranatense TaxID=1862640 RepID=A0AAV8SQQ8_9ROSI|nr:hypothetical protein K2173_002759 [Erythroxylum novogranatense]